MKILGAGRACFTPSATYVVAACSIGMKLIWPKKYESGFNEHLDRPTRFSRPKGPRNRAICWFRDSALRHIARIREMVAILESHDVKLEMLKTRKPGYVVYEDEFQVVAEPFSDCNF